jgi:hypothetical protein
VTAQAGDYTASQITNAVDLTQTYVNPPWITSLPWAKVTNPPNFMVDQMTTKGDLPARGDSGSSRLPVGADGSVLTADSTQALGLRWAAASGVSSVFGRVGAVVAAAGDYTVAQVTGAVPNTRRILTGLGLSGGGDLTLDRTIAIVPDTVNQQVQVLASGTTVGTRHALNFISGANVSVSVTDNAGSNRIDVTISSTGGSGGMVDPTTLLGDLIVRGSTTVQRLPVGSDGQVLTADSTQPLGIKWANPTGGSGGQTPWTSDINAANHALNSVSAIGIGMVSNPAAARLAIQTTGTEDGVTVQNTVNTEFASASVMDDGGNYLSMRSYGSAFATDPGLSSIESNAGVKFVANSAEVMRLAGGHLLVGTATDDTVNMLQVNGTVRSAAGGFVFPDGTTQTTASTPATAPVRSVFGRTGVVVAQGGDYSAAQITNAVDATSTYANPSWITSLAWAKITGAPATGVSSVFARTGAVGAATGDYNAAQVTNAVDATQAYANPAWITSLAWAKITGAPAGGSQTPWASDIDAAGFRLKSAGRIGVGNDASVLGNANSGNAHVIIGPTAPVGTPGAAGELHLVANYSTNNGFPGGVFFDNYDIVATDKTVAMILCGADAAYNGAYLAFYTASDSQTRTERMRISGTGNVGIGQAASAGTTRLSVAAPGSNWGAQFGNGNNNILVGGTDGGGNSAINSQSWPLALQCGGVSKLFVASTGVGIGTASPGQPLTVNGVSGWPVTTGTAATTGAFRVTTPGGGMVMDFGCATANPYNGWIQISDRNNLALTYPLLLQPNGGTVGIGVINTNPGANLDIQRVGGDSNDILRIGTTQGFYYGFARDDGTGALRIQGSQAANANIILAPTAGNIGIGINANNPAYKLDVAGDVNCTGAFRVNGTAIGGGITTQNVVSGSRALGTVYQNTTGKPMCVHVAINGAGNAVSAVADSANPPTTTVACAGNGGTTSTNVGVTFWVLPNNYYKAVLAGSGTLAIWTEWT